MSEEQYQEPQAQEQEPEAPEEEKKEEPKQEAQAPKLPEAKAAPVFVQGKLKCKSDPLPFKNILTAAATLDIEVVPFYFDQDGCKVRAMSESHNRMLDAFISADDFDEYDCEGEVRIGLKLSKTKPAYIGFEKYMARAKDAIEMEIGKEAGIKLSLIRGDHSTDYALHYFEAAPLSRVPNVKFDVQFNMERVVFESMIDDGLLISNRAEFEAVDQALYFRTTGDAGTSESIFGTGSMFPINININKPARTTYDIDVFKKMLGALNADEILFEYSQNIPARITANLAPDLEVVTSVSKMVFYLAPRIQSDTAKKEGKKKAHEAEQAAEKEDESAEHNQ
jgi:DNA polymerase III sliding clamp (beta) subunit (PCNA family)